MSYLDIFKCEFVLFGNLIYFYIRYILFIKLSRDIFTSSLIILCAVRAILYNQITPKVQLCLHYNLICFYNKNILVCRISRDNFYIAIGSSQLGVIICLVKSTKVFKIYKFLAYDDKL